MSRVDKITNLDVLRSIGKKPEVINNITLGKLRYFGDICLGAEVSALTSYNIRKNTPEEKQEGNLKQTGYQI